MGSQGPRKEAQAREGFLGGQEGGKQPGAVVHSLELVFIKAGGRGAGQTWRGPVLAGRKAGRLEPFSRVLKRAGRGRKNKPRHTLGGCRLARDPGTTSQVPGVEDKPVGTHPRLGRLRSVPQRLFGFVRNGFLQNMG